MLLNFFVDTPKMLIKQIGVGVVLVHMYICTRNSSQIHCNLFLQKKEYTQMCILGVRDKLTLLTKTTIVQPFHA